MAIYRRGGIWWYEFEFLGQRIRESSRSGSKALAQRSERERRRSLELGTAGLKEKTANHVRRRRARLARDQQSPLERKQRADRAI